MQSFRQLKYNSDRETFTNSVIWKAALLVPELGHAERLAIRLRAHHRRERIEVAPVPGREPRMDMRCTGQGAPLRLGKRKPLYPTGQGDLGAVVTLCARLRGPQIEEVLRLAPNATTPDSS